MPPTDPADFIPVDELLSMKANGTLGALNEAQLEDYLSEQDFRSLFHMEKSDFGGLKKWKQNSLKKQQKLF
jgi:hypothetical protein